MNDGFTEVKLKRNRKAKKTPNRSTVDFECLDIDIDTVKRKVLECKKKLKESCFLTCLFATISETFTSISEVLCYGLGSFAESYISRTQLAALLAIKDRYQSKVLIYDPLFQPIEEALLSLYDIEVITFNEEGKRILSPNRNTLVFFPHCPKQLVNNFLWANWSASLSNCIILSNSFGSILEKNTKSTLDSISCLRDIASITKEVVVSVPDEFSDIFNDLSIHTVNCETVPTDFWAAREAPKYSEEVEFIGKEVTVNLKIY